MELATYPSIIALDFLGEEEVDEGVRGIIVIIKDRFGAWGDIRIREA